MNITFTNNNQITVTDKKGHILYKQDKNTFSVSKLKDLGFSESEIARIEQLIEKRKYSFYA